MTRLLNLTIKIKKDHYKNAGGNGMIYFIPPRIIELASPLIIKDQNGAAVSELRIRNDSNFGASNAKFLVNSIKKIQVGWSDWDIPISWAWENKGADTEIEFTLKNLKYDNWNSFKFGCADVPTTGTTTDTIFLERNNFETEVYENEAKDKKQFLSSVIELSNQFSDDIKKTLRDFLDLGWKLTKAWGEENIASLVSEIESYQNASAGSPKNRLYQLKNINNGSEEEVKKSCLEILREIQNLNQWKQVGIKTLTDVLIARRNGFDIIANPSLKNEIKAGKYKGFSVASQKKYKRLVADWNDSSKLTETKSNRHTKYNIDTFRSFFTNDPDQSDPQYFRGFRPGDITLGVSGSTRIFYFC